MLGDVYLNDIFEYNLATNTSFNYSNIRNTNTVDITNFSVVDGYQDALECRGNYVSCTFEKVDFNDVSLRLNVAANSMSITAGIYNGVHIAGFVESSRIGAVGSPNVGLFISSIENSDLIIIPTENQSGSCGEINNSNLIITGFGTGAFWIRDSVLTTEGSGAIYSGYTFNSKLNLSKLSGVGSSQIHISDVLVTEVAGNKDRVSFNNSHVEVEKDIITDLGTPVDQLGDNVAGTVINFVDEQSLDQTFTVDGITQPKATPYFLGGDSDLWSGLGVGAR